MKDRDFERQVRMILEAEKPQIIDAIESSFGLGSETWSEKPNFKPNRIHLIQMFDIINKYIFENKLDRTEDKQVVDEATDPSLKYAAAAFVNGCIKGMPHKIIIVKHAEVSNFFNVFCAMIHEMIHLYDFEFGPLGKMINDNILVGNLNWGLGYVPSPAAALAATEFPKLKSQYDKPGANTGFKKLVLQPSQLPNDMPNAFAKQYQFPWFKDPKYAEFYLKTGQYHPGFLPAKYVLSDVSMYDVHGHFFQKYADRANSLGFDVTEVFEAWRPHKLRKTWENERSAGESAMNPAEAIASRISTDEHVAFEYRDAANWAVEIT